MAKQTTTSIWKHSTKRQSILRSQYFWLFGIQTFHSKYTYLETDIDDRFNDEIFNCSFALKWEIHRRPFRYNAKI